MSAGHLLAAFPLLSSPTHPLKNSFNHFSISLYIKRSDVSKLRLVVYLLLVGFAGAAEGYPANGI